MTDLSVFFDVYIDLDMSLKGLFSLYEILKIKRIKRSTTILAPTRIKRRVANGMVRKNIERCGK